MSTCVECNRRQAADEMVPTYKREAQVLISYNADNASPTHRRVNSVFTCSRCVLVLVLCVVWSAPVANAQDRIWIEPKRTSNQCDWYPASIQVTEANVLHFDSNQLRCMIPGDNDQQVYSSSQIIWVEPVNRSKIQRQAIQQFNAGQYAETIQLLPEILQERPPLWHQQWLTMMTAVAAFRSGQNNVALELVAELDRHSLPPLVVAWLPIQWQNQRMKPDVVGHAAGRMNDSSELVQLTAASWLLSSPRRNDALAVLDTLRVSKRMEVREFAEILHWRVAIPPTVKQQSVRWQQKIDHLPMVLQTGPTLTLIDKLNSAGLADRATPLQWSLKLTPIHAWTNLSQID